jgi:hypothetical protein
VRTRVAATLVVFHAVAAMAGDDATIKGSFSLPKGQRVNSLAATIFRDGQASEPFQCAVANTAWSCAVPAGARFDLRLEPKSFAPVYVWDLAVANGAVADLGVEELHAGASIDGWVQDPRGHALAKARLTLVPVEREQRRGEIRQRTAVSNERGFFHFIGLAAGTYALLSRAEGLSPVAVPEVTVREGESLTWPRAIRHAPVATAEVTIDPPCAPSGKPWSVEAEEREPLLPIAARTVVRGVADAQGRCVLTPLRAGRYVLRVVDGAGSVMATADADFTGGSHVVVMDANAIAVRGVVRAGADPIDADLVFENGKGAVVRASTSDDGSYRASFPSGGEWTPTVSHPRNRATRARLHASPVRLPERGEEAHDIDIILAGGRIRGAVTDPTGATPSGGAIVEQDGRRITSQRLGDDAKFDLVGLASGTYQVWAQCDSGASKAVIVDLGDGESKSVDLLLDPYQVISAIVLTPDGLPASGAAVAVCEEGSRWRRGLVTDLQGRFTLHEAPSVTDLRVVVSTYSYPAAVARLPLDAREPVTIVLPASGGIVRVPAMRKPWWVGDGQTLMPFTVFLFPEPYGRFNGGIYLAPGAYRACPEARLDQTCREVNVGNGTEQLLELETTP